MTELTDRLSRAVRRGAVLARSWMSSARAIGQTYRVVTVRNGPAQGMRIGLRFASNEYRDGLVEVPVQQAVVDLMRPGCVFFDIGANVGFFTLVASNAARGKATLIAFEPRADVADALSANLQRNQVQAQVWAVAVGEREGIAALLVAEHPGGATIEPGKAFDTQRIDHVPQVSIDVLVEQGRVPVPDVVKIDVEGAEPAVVRGMSRTLGLGRTQIVYEIDAPTRAAVEEQFLEVETLLAELGYVSVRLDPSYEDSGWHVIHAVARPAASTL